MTADKLTKEEREALNLVLGGVSHVHMGEVQLLAKALDRLAPKPEPERLWVNVWRGPSGMVLGSSHSSKMEADEDRADEDRQNPGGFTYLGRAVINLDGSQPTWEGPDA